MKPKILVIAGPTASGKKKIALAAAEVFNGEILSADSRKVYRYLDIGTAKPSRETRKRIPHHLIDIIDPDEPFSAGAWVQRASDAVSGILARGKLPIISGGTGFYMKAFMEGLSKGISSDPEVRETLMRLLDEKGVAELYRKLKEIDPQRAAELHENDSIRVMRALEIFFTTGRTFTEMHENDTVSVGDYDYFSIGIVRKRHRLYTNIDNRVDTMISNGLVDELKSVLNRGYSRNLTALDSVGYKEWFPYLDSDQQFETCLEAVKRNTRKYAKRQMTWFRAQKEIRWVDPDEPGSVEAIFSKVKSWLSIP